MAFRDLMPKYKSKKEADEYKAVPKKPGRGVELPKKSSGNVAEDFIKLVTDRALRYVTTNVRQTTRTLYKGSADTQYRTYEQDVVVSVKLEEICGTNVIQANVIIEAPDIEAGWARARTRGAQLGQMLVKELNRLHPPKRLPDVKGTPDYSDLDDKTFRQEIIGEFIKKSDVKKSEPPKEPKKVCPICGPEDDDYPEWGDCEHDY